MIKDKRILNKLFHYMKPYIWRYILAVFLMILIVTATVLSPYIAKLSLAEIGKESINIKFLLILFVATILITITSNILQFCQTILMQYTGQRIVFAIRAEVFSHIQTFSHNQFNNIPVGTLVTRATSDINVLFQLYTNVLLNILKYVSTIIGVLIAMFAINTQLALLILSVMPIVVVLTFIFKTLLRKSHRRVRNEVANMNAFLSENISGMKVTQIFNQEEKKYQEFLNANTKLKKVTFKQICTFAVFRPSIYLVYILSIVLIIYFGGNQVLSFAAGTLAVAVTFDELYAFYKYISEFFNPIQALADQYDQLQSAFAAAEKIFTILETKSEIVEAEDAIDVKITGNIEFKDVWFSYIPGEWVLKGVSFKIKPKEAFAFVGATGSGKSTILGLITRNYDIQKGQILIDGVDIKKIKLTSLRSQIGQMLQDVFLFSGTIADNIRLNDDTITDEHIIKACKEVNAMHFINKFPNGLYYEVTERGNNLSLGEKQLISFARTIVHKPSVMILDEATANIDTETEQIIQGSLEKVIQNNTMIMVAHRLSTIQYANTIYVFNHGEIIEQGTHQELLKKKGRYYQLYLLQYQKNQIA